MRGRLSPLHLDQPKWPSKDGYSNLELKDRGWGERNELRSRNLAVTVPLFLLPHTTWTSWVAARRRWRNAMMARPLYSPAESCSTLGNRHYWGFKDTCDSSPSWSPSNPIDFGKFRCFFFFLP